MRWADLIAPRTVSVQVVVAHGSDTTASEHKDAHLTPCATSGCLAFHESPFLQNMCCPCERCTLVAPLLCVVGHEGPGVSPCSPCHVHSVVRSSVPLRCPVRSSTPRVPARFAGCRHLSCFDCFAVLHQWLHRLIGFDWDDFCAGSLRDVVWRCPCCRAAISVSIHAPVIVVDGWLLGQLQEHDGSREWTLAQDEQGVISVQPDRAHCLHAPRPSMVVTVNEE
jgi:hypothetical protein